MDRIAVKRSLKKNYVPAWKCPHCKVGALTLKAEDLKFEEFRKSIAAHKMEDFFPDWVDYIFSATLRCSSPKCREIVACCGKGGVEQEYTGFDEDGYPECDWIPYFDPSIFIPHLHLFEVPEKTPELVSDEIEKSFAVFFADNKAAANHIRSAIEQLLNELKIKKFTVKNKKRRSLPLHFRIDTLPTKYIALKKALLAIKWLGNAGSHPGESLEKDDVLDAYEILEHLLNDLYNPKKATVEKLVQAINKKKGPLAKGRRKFSF
jgi:hypothetical protein